jgi:hypothetical protein
MHLPQQQLICIARGITSFVFGWYIWAGPAPGYAFKVVVQNAFKLGFPWELYRDQALSDIYRLWR